MSFNINNTELRPCFQNKDIIKAYKGNDLIFNTNVLKKVGGGWHFTRYGTKGTVVLRPNKFNYDMVWDSSDESAKPLVFSKYQNSPLEGLYHNSKVTMKLFDSDTPRIFINTPGFNGIEDNKGTDEGGRFNQCRVSFSYNFLINKGLSWTITKNITAPLSGIYYVGAAANTGMKIVVNGTTYIDSWTSLERDILLSLTDENKSFNYGIGESGHMFWYLIPVNLNKGTNTISFSYKWGGGEYGDHKCGAFEIYNLNTPTDEELTHFILNTKTNEEVLDHCLYSLANETTISL